MGVVVGWREARGARPAGRGSTRSWRRPGSSRLRGCRPAPGRTSPRARAAAACVAGWSIGVRLGRPPPRYWTVVGHARRGDLLDVRARTPRRSVSGSCAATSRQLTLAWAWAGMIVLRALALEAAPDAVDVERRARAAPLEGREAGLADERREPEVGSGTRPRRTAARRGPLAPPRTAARRRRRSPGRGSGRRGP